MRRPITIGTARNSGQRIVITCGSCSTITHIWPDDLHLKDNFELTALEQFYPCPECGHSNSESGYQLSIGVS
jgi:hypothetical protein